VFLQRTDAAWRSRERGKKALFLDDFYISKFDIPIWEEKKKANIFKTVLKRKWILELKLVS